MNSWRQLEKFKSHPHTVGQMSESFSVGTRITNTRLKKTCRSGFYINLAIAEMITFGTVPTLFLIETGLIDRSISVVGLVSAGLMSRQLKVRIPHGLEICYYFVLPCDNSDMTYIIRI